MGLLKLIGFALIPIIKTTTANKLRETSSVRLLPRNPSIVSDTSCNSVPNQVSFAFNFAGACENETLLGGAIKKSCEVNSWGSPDSIPLSTYLEHHG